MGTLIRDAQGLLVAIMSKKQKFVNESNKIEVIATVSAEFTLDFGIRKVVLQTSKGFTHHCECFKVAHYRVVKRAATAIQKMGSQPPKKKKKKNTIAPRFSYYTCMSCDVTGVQIFFF